MGNKRRKLSSGSYQAVDTDTAKGTREIAQKDQRSSLFVRSLPASVTAERLAEHFSQSFPLKHSLVVTDRQTKVSKGFGFVTFADAEDARAALEEFNHSVLDGRKIQVEIAEARHRDADNGRKSSFNTTAEKLKAKREMEKTDAQPPKLIVRNLPWSIQTSDDLAALFRSYGKVKHAVVPKKSSKVQYGFGIVIIRGKKNAEKALAGVNGKEVDGRTLAVDWAVDKQTWEEMQGSVPQKENSADNGKEDVDIDTAKVQVRMGSDEEKSDAEASDVEHDENSIDGDEIREDALDGSSNEKDSLSDAESESRNTRNDTTVFIRNLPFTTDDGSLREHFLNFGPIRYARVVYDQETERSRGTAFVCFFNEEDAKACVKNAPKHEIVPAKAKTDKKRKGELTKHSVLEDETTDPSGRYTLEGRVLQVSRALSRSDAEKRAEEASAERDVRDRDKRRLYLLSEGTVSKSSQLYSQLGKAEMDIRESSARQRQKLIKTNPNLCLSLTRLSVRNLPRSIDSKDLKALAREAVVGFATDVKAGLREPLTKEELSRGGDEMREAERKRKVQGKGIVRQAKVVFEDKEGSKVKDGAGRSRGYGFIEYVSHRNALAGLRWLNGHLIKTKSAGDKTKRLIVEFAIENAQVVQRRNEREKRIREGGGRKSKDRTGDAAKEINGKKRKRDVKGENEPVKDEKPTLNEDEKNRVAKRNRIIAKKRQSRRTRKG